MNILQPKCKFRYDLTRIHFDELPPDILYRIFADGRIGGLVVEHLFAFLFDNVKRADSERAPYDLEVQHEGDILLYQSKVGHRRTENSSIDLSRSRMKGVGRRFDAQACIDDTLDLDGFIVTDLHQLPRLTVWTLPSKQLIRCITEKSFKPKFAKLDQLVNQ